MKTEFLGYNMTKCSLNRKLGELPAKVIIKITNINMSSKTSKLNIDYLVDFVHEDSHISSFEYQTWFSVEDEQFKKCFVNESKKKNHSYSDEMNQDLKYLLQLSYPYIRESVFSITNDLSGAINMPTFDASVLFQTTAEFTRIPVETKKQTRKRVPSKQKSDSEKKN